MGRAMAGRTGACAQAGGLPTGSNQTRVHTEGQRQAQAAGHLNLAGSGLHDGSDLVLEPIFEADLPSELYAYRPGRNAQQAVVAAGELLFRGHPEVVDADLADYFGSIPHAELLKSVARRIVDRRVLHLIRMWLDCPVEETDNRGRKTRTTEARDERRGIPQGSPISPLLANIYMRRFVLGWKMFGLERTLGSRLVTYADDLVILCRRGKTEAALQRLREITGKLKLTVSEEKTRICKVPEGEFDFLGYTFGQMYSARTGQARIGYRPSKKSIQRAVEKVHPCGLYADPRRRRAASLQTARACRANLRAAQQCMGRPTHHDPERLFRVSRPARPVLGISVLAIPRD
jgi:group II intron reverse transcriptase/maturase